MGELAIRQMNADLDVDLQSAVAVEKVQEKSELPLTEEGWVALAERSNDGLRATLHTLGAIVTAETQSRVHIDHRNGVTLDREGPLSEIAPIYKHPMAYVSEQEARTAFPTPNQLAA